jgi:hypothetical protein
VSAIVIAVLRSRAAGKPRIRRRLARRQPVLEDRIREALDAPRAQFGEIFVSYAIWRRENVTRLELRSGDPWLALSDFTRSLVVRHLWRALEGLVHGSVVIVDTPAQAWSKAIDSAFDDHGVDPWGPRPPTLGSGGPQFAHD